MTLSEKNQARGGSLVRRPRDTPGRWHGGHSFGIQVRAHQDTDTREERQRRGFDDERR